jgi:hypothetical protein
MDAKLFRLPTQPNFYASIAAADPFRIEQRQKHSQVPTPDSRFPGWAAPMADGRLVTSYQNHCSRNVAPGRQFATKGWMQQNGAELIRLGRERLSGITGAVYGTAATMAPPAFVTRCTSEGCSTEPTGAAGGIGTERAAAESAAPPLFGTWDPTTTGYASMRVSPSANQTRKYEGGRNTPRGGVFAGEMV